jgi:H+-translocating NAD(P) transhydrogenase subunit alpha
MTDVTTVVIPASCMCTRGVTAGTDDTMHMETDGAPRETAVAQEARQRSAMGLSWVPAFAGMTVVLAPTAALASSGDAVSPFVYQFMVFVIAIFVGYFVVWSVTASLHTPLMSVTNAISSVIVVGALLSVGVVAMNAGSWLAKLFGFLALIMASVNIFGGFMVTSRMLAMYKKKDSPPKK